MAPWGGVGTGIKTPTLLFCGAADTVAPCDMASGAYSGIPAPTPKILVTLTGTDHLQWVGSNTAPGSGAAAKLALAFQKVYLEGDTRWKTLLGMMPMGVQSVKKANAD
jgi:pimeloyl-ACP methyl ester carboxylesterase